MKPVINFALIVLEGWLFTIIQWNSDIWDAMNIKWVPGEITIVLLESKSGEIIEIPFKISAVSLRFHIFKTVT